MNTYPFSIRTAGICLLSLTLSVTACKKNDDPVTPVKTDNGMAFVDKTLKLSAVTSDPLIDMDGDGKVDKDLLPFLRPCDLDNTIRFEKGGRLAGNNGTVRCDENGDEPAEPAAGGWAYNDKTHILTLTTDTASGENVSEWEIQESSSTSVKAKVSAKGSTEAFKLVMTWTAQ